MTAFCHCSCCDRPLEPAQQLRFLVESDNLGNPSYLAQIRALPSLNGKPIPVCKACQARIEATPRPMATTMLRIGSRVGESPILQLAHFAKLIPL